MPQYRLLGAHRAPDGTIGDVLIDEQLTAADRTEAISHAVARGRSLGRDEANAFWLVDKKGNLFWSHRLGDPDAEA